jgi:hypothetical protein
MAAREGSFSGVLAHVPVEGAAIDEPHAALGARVATFARVDHHVLSWIQRFIRVGLENVR